MVHNLVEHTNGVSKFKLWLVPLLNHINIYISCFKTNLNASKSGTAALHRKNLFQNTAQAFLFMASFSSVFTVCFLSLVTKHAFISCECLMYLNSLESTGGTIVSLGNSYVSPVLSKLSACIKTHYIYMHMPWMN